MELCWLFEFFVHSWTDHFQPMINLSTRWSIYNRIVINSVYQLGRLTSWYPWNSVFWSESASSTTSCMSLGRTTCYLTAAAKWHARQLGPSGGISVVPSVYHFLSNSLASCSFFCISEFSEASSNSLSSSLSSSSLSLFRQHHSHDSIGLIVRVKRRATGRAPNDVDCVARKGKEHVLAENVENNDDKTS